MSSQLNYPEPLLPAAPETKVFRAFEGVLKSDPILNPFIQTWSTWKGEDVDMLMFPENISHTLCPFFRISPFPVASDLETEIEHRSDLMLRAEIAVVGTNVDVLMNLWHAVYLAIYPWNNPTLRGLVMSAIQTAGARRPVMKLPAYGSFLDSDNIPILGAQGSFQFVMLIGP